MIYEPNRDMAMVRRATVMMLDTAAHFRKIGKYDAAHRAISTIKSWREEPSIKEAA